LINDIAKVNGMVASRRDALLTVIEEANDAERFQDAAEAVAEAMTQIDNLTREVTMYREAKRVP
jgi:hypothetical protein